MEAATPTTPRIRIFGGELEERAVTSRVVIPSTAQGVWAPYLRVAEVAATVNRKLPSHGHEGEEVLTYGVEGSASISIGSGPPRALGPSTVVLLTTPGKTMHAISPAEGSSVRWFSMVVGLSPGAAADTRLQWGRPAAGEPQADGTVVRRFVGPGSSVVSASHLECDDIAFASDGTSFRRIGHDRRAVLYALAGHGNIDSRPLDEGEVALIENVSGIGLHGRPGFRAVLACAPRPPASLTSNPG